MRDDTDSHADEVPHDERTERLLLTGVFSPYGVQNRWADGSGCKMELMDNQITREQGIHSPRQAYRSFGLYLMAENISVPCTVLDFPRWRDFTRELKKGYTHLGISFIVPNVLKAKRMAEYVRRHHPDIKIILGGYGSIIPELREIVPCDEVCHGEGITWLREYFCEDPDAPIRHPAIIGPVFQYLYGVSTKPRGAILMPGVGCENACSFCVTSHKFGRKYIPLLPTGKDIFEACRHAEEVLGSRGFSIMDENFLKRTDRARELLQEMTRHEKPYVFDIFSSADVVAAVGVDFLVRLGVRMVWIGVEYKRARFKKLEGIDRRDLIAELQAKGIIVIASTILFADHHDREALEKDIDWAIGLGSDLLQFMNYTAYPTTTLHKQLESQGRLKDVHYRHHHGGGELHFEHPHIQEPEAHRQILRDAFRRKYETDGPAVVSMALTALRGYRAAEADIAERERHGVAWNEETLRYESRPGAPPDEFMRLRLRMMAKIARAFRPVLRAAHLYAPNRSARRRAREAIDLMHETFGPARLKDRLLSGVIVAAAAAEATRSLLSRTRGRDGVLRQPPVLRTEYR